MARASEGSGMASESPSTAWGIVRQWLQPYGAWSGGSSSIDHDAARSRARESSAPATPVTGPTTASRHPLVDLGHERVDEGAPRHPQRRRGADGLEQLVRRRSRRRTGRVDDRRASAVARSRDGPGRVPGPGAARRGRHADRPWGGGTGRSARGPRRRAAGRCPRRAGVGGRGVSAPVPASERRRRRRPGRPSGWHRSARRWRRRPSRSRPDGPRVPGSPTLRTRCRAPRAAGAHRGGAPGGRRAATRSEPSARAGRAARTSQPAPAEAEPAHRARAPRAGHRRACRTRAARTARGRLPVLSPPSSP